MKAKSQSPGIVGRKSGFTLIELLVVVAIMTLLIAILLPSLQSARAQAKSTACLSNLRQLSLAANMYGDENERYVPAWGFSNVGGVNTGFNPAKDYWYVTLAPYVGATNFAWAAPSNAAQSKMYQSMVRCYFCPVDNYVSPTSVWYEQYPFTYTINRMCSCDVMDGSGQHLGKYNYLKSNMVNPASFLVFSDCAPGDRTGFPWYGGANVGGNGSHGMLSFRHGPTGTAGALTNACFLDGHAESLTGYDYVRATPDDVTLRSFGMYRGYTPTSFPIGTFP